LREAVLESGQRIYLRPEAVVTGADATGASVVDAGGRFSINVAFTSAASTRLGEATKIHVGRPIAILLNGKVISAPMLRSMIRGSAVITGNFSRTEAEQIASGLVRRGAAAGGTPDWNAYVRETQRSLAVLAHETGVPAATNTPPAPVTERPARIRPVASALSPVAAVPEQRYKGSDPGVVLPTAISKVNPRYTQAAMDAKIQGVVELSAVVRSDGSVSDVAVVQSLDTTYGLDDAAVEAVRQWIFNPGTKDGQAVDVEIQITIRFTLT
jgi:protein TonB